MNKTEPRPPPLRLSSVSLRDMGLSDKEQVRQWRNSDWVSRYMYTNHSISRDEHERWFHKILRDPSVKYWIICFKGKDVGVVNLYEINTAHSRVFWAFYIGAHTLRGKGVGSLVECLILDLIFYKMRFHKLCCEVLSTNPEVVDMHEAFGFKCEGFFREYVLRDGRFYDVYRLAILIQDWETRRPSILEKLKIKGLLEPTITI